jgi:hypothetical protein
LPQDLTDPNCLYRIFNTGPGNIRASDFLDLSVHPAIFFITTDLKVRVRARSKMPRMAYTGAEMGISSAVQRSWHSAYILSSPNQSSSFKQMIITGDPPLSTSTKPEAMLALYEQGLGSKPIHRTYIFEKMDRSFYVHEETPGAHVPSRVPHQCLIRFYGQGPQTISLPKLLKAIYAVRAHEDSNQGHRDSRAERGIKTTNEPNSFYTLLRPRSIIIPEIPNLIWQSLKQNMQTLSAERSSSNGPDLGPLVSSLHVTTARLGV